MNKFDVLVKPMLSEKSTDLRDNEGKYTFTVKLDATKKDIEKAFKALFDVEVKAVNTVITRGKIKRRGAVSSKAPNVKKAVVTLAKGVKIDIFKDL